MTYTYVYTYIYVYIIYINLLTQCYVGVCHKRCIALIHYHSETKKGRKIIISMSNNEGIRGIPKKKKSISLIFQGEMGEI